jgi:hypothetical protein
VSNWMTDSTGKRRVLSVILSVLLLTGSWTPVAAQSAKCVSRINGLKPNTTMLVVGHNGQRFAGHLVAVDAETRILQLTSESELGDYTREIPYDAIREIRYAAAGKVHPTYAFWGLLIGAAAGFLIGQSIDSAKEAADETSGGAMGAAFGAGGGVVIGSGISLFIPSQHKIKCDEKAEPVDSRE